MRYREHERIGPIRIVLIFRYRKGRFPQICHPYVQVRTSLRVAVNRGLPSFAAVSSPAVVQSEQDQWCQCPLTCEIQNVIFAPFAVQDIPDLDIAIQPHLQDEQPLFRKPDKLKAVLSFERRLNVM